MNVLSFNWLLKRVFLFQWDLAFVLLNNSHNISHFEKNKTLRDVRSSQSDGSMQANEPEIKIVRYLLSQL